MLRYAKTLYKPERPKDINNIIKGYTNNLLPAFFTYAKDKLPEQVKPWKPTAVNYLEDIIPNPRIKFSNKIGKINPYILMHDNNYVFNDAYNIIIETYDYLNSHKYQFYKTIDDKSQLNSKRYDSYLYQQIKNKLLALPFSKEVIVDTLVHFLYTNRKESKKETLWKCFGEEIYNNIKKNVDGLGNICPICGARIEDVDSVQQKYCSEECAEIARREYWREYKRNGG